MNVYMFLFYITVAKKQAPPLAESGGLGLQIASVSGSTDITLAANKEKKESQKVKKCGVITT